MAICKICKEHRESYAMKTSDMCNICSFYKNSKLDYERTKRKFRNAIKINI